MLHSLILHGDCIATMRSMPDECIDAVVTDPPYELGFMGKRWDASGIAFSVDLWREVLRVLKPGGHMLAFSGTRTYHRMVCAIEDAGFEIRDQLAWMYGSGFPKSLDVARVIADAQGLEKVERPHPSNQCPGGQWCHCNERDERAQSGATKHPPEYVYPEGSDAEAWDGWGTALKPAQEPIVLARKPLIGTVAANVLAYGCGGINVDGCRIEGAGAEAGRSRHGGGLMEGHSWQMPDSESSMPAGRWPANVLLDEAAAAMLDEQSGTSKSTKSKPRGSKAPGDGWGMTRTGAEHDDSGGASRFFYVAKASRSEREAGLDHLPKHTAGELTGGRKEGSAGLDNPRAGAGRTSQGRANVHPTVKPITLMRYLVRLITPPGGVVLDPFAGSGTTLCAAVLERFHSIGIELTPEYIPIALARIEHVRQHPEDYER